MQPKQENAGINFFIHDLHPYGGQDRSTLEILNQLSAKMPVHVYAYSFQNPGVDRSNIIFHRCPPMLRRPVLLKSVWFHLWSAWIRFTSPRRLTFATGACSLFADIVHVQFVANAWKEEKRRLTVKKTPLMRAYHSLLAAYNEKLEKALFSNRKKYAAISSSVAVDLKKHFQLNDITVIYHGVDVERFRPPTDAEEKSQLRRKLSLPETSKVFLFAGSYDRKGMATLVSAGKRLMEKHPNAKIVAVGDGDADKYRKMAGPDCHWLELRPPSKEIELYFRAADCFVLPTLYEPFGLVILEAMSTGLPVIVSRCAGAAELVDEGKNGLLLNNPTDVNELLQKMDSLISQPELGPQLSAEARTRALTRSWASVAGEFERLISPTKDISQ